MKQWGQGDCRGGGVRLDAIAPEPLTSFKALSIRPLSSLPTRPDKSLRRDIKYSFRSVALWESLLVCVDSFAQAWILTLQVDLS